jgi:hypothetical protein
VVRVAPIHAFAVAIGMVAASCKSPPKSLRTRVVTPSPGSDQPHPDDRTPVDNAGGVEVNPRDAQGRRIFADGERCLVRGDRDPDETQVDCPPAMDDPAWDECSGINGLFKRPDGTCYCPTHPANADDHYKVDAVATRCPK